MTHLDSTEVSSIVTLLREELYYQVSIDQHSDRCRKVKALLRDVRETLGHK